MPGSGTCLKPRRRKKYRPLALPCLLSIQWWMYWRILLIEDFVPWVCGGRVALAADSDSGAVLGDDLDGRDHKPDGLRGFDRALDVALLEGRLAHAASSSSLALAASAARVFSMASVIVRLICSISSRARRSS